MTTIIQTLNRHVDRWIGAVAASVHQRCNAKDYHYLEQRKPEVLKLLQDAARCYQRYQEWCALGNNGSQWDWSCSLGACNWQNVIARRDEILARYKNGLLATEQGIPDLCLYYELYVHPHSPLFPDEVVCQRGPCGHVIAGSEHDLYGLIVNFHEHEKLMLAGAENEQKRDEVHDHYTLGLLTVQLSKTPDDPDGAYRRWLTVATSCNDQVLQQCAGNELMLSATETSWQMLQSDGQELLQQFKQTQRIAAPHRKGAAV